MKTDITRWSNPQSLKSEWDSRTFKLARMIPESAETVIEFGAANMALKDMLWTHQEYTPSDLVDRGPGTIVYDLNVLPYSFIERKYDVTVFSGVFEYIADVPALVEYISTFSRQVICSYAHVPLNPDKRKNSGWINAFTPKQFSNIFHKNGYTLTQQGDWGKQALYNFTRV